MEADDLLCSRNARPEKALVGRAQSRIDQAPSEESNKRAWREHDSNWSDAENRRSTTLPLYNEGAR
jgi:hypothetical protein